MSLATDRLKSLERLRVGIPEDREATSDGQNRQSPMASIERTRTTVSGHSAGPRETNTTPTNADHAIRIAMQ